MDFPHLNHIPQLVQDATVMFNWALCCMMYRHNQGSPSCCIQQYNINNVVAQWTKVLWCLCRHTILIQGNHLPGSMYSIKFDIYYPVTTKGIWRYSISHSILKRQSPAWNTSTKLTHMYLTMTIINKDQVSLQHVCLLKSCATYDLKSPLYTRCFEWQDTVVCLREDRVKVNSTKLSEVHAYFIDNDSNVLWQMYYPEI